MKIHPSAYAIAGSAAAAAILWYSFSAPDEPYTKSLSITKTEQLNDGVTPPKLSAKEKDRPHHKDLVPAPQIQQISAKDNSAAERKRPQLTRSQLIARAAVIEKQANLRLDQLTEQLGLSEEQQDFIFPILAKSLPTFHPSLKPDGNNLLTDIGTNVRPGSPVSDVEAEIYAILDEEQKTLLEEEALDREAWWDDIVALLDAETQNTPESPTVDLSKPVQDEPKTTNQEEREENAATNQIDDFSRLLRNN